MQITMNGERREIAGPTTVADLLAQCQLPVRGVAVEVNSQLVPRARHAEQLVQEGDWLEVVTLVGGG